MQIVNQQFHGDLSTGKDIRLNIGSAGGQKDGFYGLDIMQIDDAVDIIADLNSPLSLIPDNSIAEIYSCHVLEHVRNLVQLMEELHRIVRPGGMIEIRVPHFSNPYYYSDPTHERFFGVYSMYYFVATELQPEVRKVPAFYSKARFHVEEITITLLNNTLFDRLLTPRLFSVINRNFARQDLYERRLCRLFPANGLIFRLRPQK